MKKSFILSTVLGFCITLLLTTTNTDPFGVKKIITSYQSSTDNIVYASSNEALIIKSYQNDLLLNETHSIDGLNELTSLNKVLSVDITQLSSVE